MAVGYMERGVPGKIGSVPSCAYETNFNNFHTESRWQQLSQLFFRRSWVWGHGLPPWPPLDRSTTGWSACIECGFNSVRSL